MGIGEKDTQEMTEAERVVKNMTRERLEIMVLKNIVGLEIELEDKLVSINSAKIKGNNLALLKKDYREIINTLQNLGYSTEQQEEKYKLASEGKLEY